MSVEESRAGQRAIIEARRAKLAERVVHPRRHGVRQYLHMCREKAALMEAFDEPSRAQAVRSGAERLARWARKEGTLR